MNVVLLSPVPVEGNPEIGSAYYTRALAQRLTSAGIDVEIWAKRTESPILRGADDPQPSILKIWRPGFGAWLDIVRAIKTRRPRLLHIQHAMFVLGDGAAGELSMLALLATLIVMRQRVVITCHDIPELRQITPEYIKLHKYRFPAGLVRFGLATLFWLIGVCASVVISHSEQFSEILAVDYKIPLSKLAVIKHLAIPYTTVPQSSARETLRLSHSKKYILFFGFLTGYKGVELLLDAMTILKDRSPSFHLLLGAGEHPKIKNTSDYQAYYESIRSRAESLENVTFVGFIPDEAIDLYIDAADVAVFPYVEFQGMSGPLNQCASHGKDALVSDAIAQKIPELKACSFLCEPQEIADAITRYLSDPAFAEQTAAISAIYAKSVRSDEFLDLTVAAYAQAG